MATKIDPWGYWDYQGIGAGRLTSYASGTGQPNEIAKAMLSPFRELERVHHALLDMLSVERATGTGLDAFGEMVSIQRLGRDDATYREAIKQKRFASGGSGTWGEVKNVIKTLTGGVTRKVDHFPAAYVMVITESANITSAIKSRLDEISVAGVAAYPVFDFGLGGFALSGIAAVANNVLGVAPPAPVTSPPSGDAMGVHPATDVVMGASGSAILPLGGTPMGSTRERDNVNVNLGSRAAGAYYWGSF